MENYLERFYKPLVLRPVTMAHLAKAEGAIIRADELISHHPLCPAIRHQMMLIEALSSIAVDGSAIQYSDLARFEFLARSNRHLRRDAHYLLRQAEKHGLPNPKDTVSALFLIRTIDWISEEFNQSTNLDETMLHSLHILYDEDEINYLQNNGQGKRDRHLSSEMTRSSKKALSDREDMYFKFFNTDIFTPSTQAELSHALLQHLGIGQRRQDSYERLFSHMIFYRRGLLTKSIAPLAVGPIMNIERHATSIYGNISSLTKNDDTVLGKYDFEDVSFCTAAPAKVMTASLRALETIQKTWTEALGSNCSHTLNDLIRLFLCWSYLTIDVASRKLDRSFSTTSNAFKKLESAGIIKEHGCLNKSRLYYAPDVIVYFEGMMKRLSSGVKTTRDEALKKIDYITDSKNRIDW